MLGERFVIVLPNGRRIEADTVVSLRHSSEAKATKYPVEGRDGKPASSATDHVVREPRSTEVEAIISDTPLDPALQPVVANRAEMAWLLLEATAEAGQPVQVFAGMRMYDRALLQRLECEETVQTLGWVRFKLQVQELLTATSRTARLRVSVKSKHKHKPKAQNGVKFKDKIKAVVDGKATGV